MKSTADTLVMGVAGIGGYAAAMADLILESGERLDPPVRLAAVCDPEPEAHIERVEQLRSQGVQVFDTYEALLAVEAIEAVWLPVPIDLHKPFTEQALEAGKAVICEKPAAGTVDEVDAMIAARDRTGLPAVIGFQDVYDPTTLPLKRRLLAGNLGPIRRAVVHGCWPRPARYFERNNWAGRLKRGQSWVLDSPAQNAMSHYINIALFLLGAEEAASATPVAVETELYRAAPIENYDTVSARVTLAEGFELLVLLTHACAETVHPTLRIEGEQGHATWNAQGITVESPAGQQVMKRDDSRRHHMFQRFVRLVRDVPDPDIAVASLEVARQHTMLINGLSEAAPIYQIPADQTLAAPVQDSTVQAVPNIERVFVHCAASFQMLHESGQLPFTQPPHSLDLRNYKRFAGPHSANTDTPAQA